MIKQLGKIGLRNQDSNKILKQMFWDLDVTRCENCSSTYILTFAHRHKRVWYRDKPELLHSYNQVLLLCQYCHNEIEYSRQKTENLFAVLRGEEVLDKRVHAMLG